VKEAFNAIAAWEKRAEGRRREALGKRIEDQEARNEEQDLRMRGRG
jgi:hypothetical protein